MAHNLDALIPGLAEARARERHNRALAFAGLTHHVCDLEIVPLTPAARLRLQLLGNAFGTKREARLVDVFVFLWQLSPGYDPNKPAGLVAWWRQRKLLAHVKRLDLVRARLEITGYIVAQLQDMPESGVGDDGPDTSPWIHWMADELTFWLCSHGGFTLESYLSTPYLVLQQVYRAWRVVHPKQIAGPRGQVIFDQPQFINQSDMLVGAWHRARREQVAEILRNQVHRQS